MRSSGAETKKNPCKHDNSSFDQYHTCNVGASVIGGGQRLFVVSGCQMLKTFLSLQMQWIIAETHFNRLYQVVNI